LKPAALARAAVAALLGLYLAWWVVKIGVVDAEIDDKPFSAAAVAPHHPRVRIDIAMAYFYAQGGRVPDAPRREALAALRQAPLAAEPYLLSAVDALARGDNDRGDRLLEEARRRDPRQRFVRLLLLDRYLREQKVPQAVLEMKALGNLIAGASVELVPALAHMAQDPSTARQMLPLLHGQPTLQEAVLESLVASGASEAVVLNVAGPSGQSVGSEPWKSALLTRLVSSGAFGRAWELWKGFAGFRGSDDGKGLYDASFAGLLGPPPFNWEFSTSGPGVAERNRNHSLQVDYYAHDNGNLASQLLMLKPGRYRLSMKASGDAPGEGSRLAWTVTCNAGDTALLQLPLTGVVSATKQFSGTFTVPANGCPAQWLRLVGIAGDVATSQNAIIAGVSLEPETGA
jgi:hypothetical protein